MDPADTLLFSVLVQLFGLIIYRVSCRIYMLGFLDYGNDLETYIFVYVTVYGKLYRFFGEGLYF